MKRLTSLLIAIAMVSISCFAQNDAYIHHTVKWFEDLETISAKYGVPSDVISKLNNLTGPVKSRQILIIPTSEKFWPKGDEPAPEAVKNEAEPKQQETFIEFQMPDTSKTDVAPEPDPFRDPRIIYRPKYTNKVSIAVWMPVEKADPAQKNNTLDFYSGVLMAAKKLGEEGINVNLTMIDYSLGLSKAIGIEQNDFIIGPFKVQQQEEVLESLSAGALVVSPLARKADTLATTHRNLFQAPARTSSFYETAIEWEETERGDSESNWIIVSSEKDKEHQKEAEDILSAAGIQYKVCMCGVSGEITDFETSYNEQAHNAIILAISSEAQLNNAIRNMGIEATNGRENISVYANSKAISYETIPVENIHKARVHVICPYYTDYNDARTLRFIHTFRALFNCEPSQYAFQGFDLAYFLGRTFSTYGVNWKYLINDEKQMDMLQASFRLQRLDNGGLVNCGMRKVLFETDFNVRLLK